MADVYGAPPGGLSGDFYGGHPMGPLAEAVPSAGLSGAGYLFSGLTFPADTGKRVRGPITRWPVAGALTVYGDSSFDYSGATDYVLYALYVDGVASTTDIGYGAGIGRFDMSVGAGGGVMSGGVVLAHAVAAGAMAGASAPQAVITLTLDGVTPLALSAGWDVLLWEVARPGLIVAAPDHTALAQTTDASGQITVTMPGSSKVAGDTVTVGVSNSAGVAGASGTRGFLAPVLVS